MCLRIIIIITDKLEEYRHLQAITYHCIEFVYEQQYLSTVQRAIKANKGITNYGRPSQGNSLVSEQSLSVTTWLHWNNVS